MSIEPDGASAHIGQQREHVVLSPNLRHVSSVSIRFHLFVWYPSTCSIHPSSFEMKEGVMPLDRQDETLAQESNQLPAVHSSQSRYF